MSNDALEGIDAPLRPYTSRFRLLNLSRFRLSPTARLDVYLWQVTARCHRLQSAKDGLTRGMQKGLTFRFSDLYKSSVYLDIVLKAIHKLNL